MGSRWLGTRWNEYIAEKNPSAYTDWLMGDRYANTNGTSRCR